MPRRKPEPVEEKRTCQTLQREAESLLLSKKVARKVRQDIAYLIEEAWDHYQRPETMDD